MSEERRPPRITIDQLLTAHDGWAEVVDGRFVPLDRNFAGTLHTIVAANLFARLDRHVKRARSGYVYRSGMTYVLYIDSSGVRTARIPDLSFLRSLPDTEDPHAPFIGAPDIAIEIVAHADSAFNLQARINDYIDHGSQQVWVVYPGLHELHRVKAVPYKQTDVFINVFKPIDTFPDLHIDLAAITTLDGRVPQEDAV